MVGIQCGSVTFSNVEAILFDKDGTLADVEKFLRSLGQRRSRLIDAQVPGVQEPLLMAFGIDGQHLNPNGLLAVGTRIENEIAAATYVAETGRDWLESLAIARKAFSEADKGCNKAEHTPLFEGVLDLIKALSAAHLKLGILSSDTSSNVKDFVNYYQLAPYVQVQQGTDGTITKPDPLLLEQACSLLQVIPQRTLIIGDSQADIQLAQAGTAAGCIAFNWREGKGLPSHSSMFVGANAVITQFSQIQIIP